MSEAENGVCRGISGEGRVLPRDAPPSLLKQWLQRYRDRRTVRGNREIGSFHFSWRRLLIAAFILLALTFMVLLLLWNYQCIIVRKMCQDQGGSEFPMFVDGEEPD